MHDATFAIDVNRIVLSQHERRAGGELLGLGLDADEAVGVGELGDADHLVEGGVGAGEADVVGDGVALEDGRFLELAPDAEVGDLGLVEFGEIVAKGAQIVGWVIAPGVGFNGSTPVLDVGDGTTADRFADGIALPANTAHVTEGFDGSEMFAALAEETTFYATYAEASGGSASMLNDLQALRMALIRRRPGAGLLQINSRLPGFSPI